MVTVVWGSNPLTHPVHKLHADTHLRFPSRRWGSALAVGGSLVWLWCPSRHKNLHWGKPRVVAIGPEAHRVLGPLLAGRNQDEFIFRPNDAIVGERGRSVITPGECYEVRIYCQAVVRAAREVM